MKKSRRQFLRLLAASSAAAATTPAAVLAADPRPRRTARRAGAPPSAAAAPPPALRAEIARQQRDLEKTLKTLRDYPLEPGSDPAFVLTPMRALPPDKKS